MVKSVKDCKKIYDAYKDLVETNYEYHKQEYSNIFKSMSCERLNDFYQCYFVSTNPKTSFVYFIYNVYTKLIKIGCSDNPIKRRNQLQSMLKTNFGIDNGLNLIGAICVPSLKGMDLERYFHETYKSFKVYGEWFSITKDEVINNCLNGDIMFNDLIIDLDSDNKIRNEGFSVIEFNEIDDYSLYYYAIEDLRDLLNKHTTDYKLTDFVIEYLLYYNTAKFNDKLDGDYRIILKESPTYGNITWDMYRWLNNNKDKYSLVGKPNYNNGKVLFPSLSIGTPKLNLIIDEVITKKAIACLSGTPFLLDMCLQEVQPNA